MKAPDLTFPQYLGKSTGKKFLMALSGAALFAFLIGHLAGNLQIFEGQDRINAYAVFLKNLGELLWVARIGLLVAVIVHVRVSIQLTLENRAARPVEYAEKRYTKASLASRTMAWSGVVVLSFIIYHLLHFTFLKVHPQYSQLVDAQGRHDVYSMMVRSFHQPVISLAYIVSVFLLCFHLSHGLQSMFQSLGVNSLRARPMLVLASRLIAWGIFAGYAAIPLGVLSGIVRLPPGVMP